MVLFILVYFAAAALAAKLPELDLAVSKVEMKPNNVVQVSRPRTFFFCYRVVVLSYNGVGAHATVGAGRRRRFKTNDWTKTKLRFAFPEQTYLVSLISSQKKKNFKKLFDLEYIKNIKNIFHK